MDSEYLDIEKIRAKPVDELDQKQKEYLSAHLMTQVQEVDLTSKDKEFLSTRMEHVCTYCGDTYNIEPVICNGQCQKCMMEQGLMYAKNPLTPVSNAFGSAFYWIFGALILWGWLSL
mgnify:FL=1|tara:strand:- start:238 stop:588 length:351 start_codon:yes stop_codon:yes gene_type:complete